MNRTKTAILGLTAAAAGGAGFVMRGLLYRLGTDAGGLLVHRHPLTLGIVLLFAALLVIDLVAVFRTKKTKCDAPVGRLPAAGSLAMALGLIAMAVQGFRAGLSVILLAVCLAAALGMLLAAVSQLRGKQPSFLTNGAVCLFLAVYLVNRYQVWSKNPQMMDFVLILGGAVVLMLYAYQMAAGNVTECSLRSWMGLGTLGIFLCLAGVWGEAAGLCLGGGIWMLTGLVAGVPEGADQS